LKPEWYQLPSSFDNKLQIDPAEIVNVEFDRDLGSLQRQLIVPKESKVLEREQKKIFDKMTSFESLDEVYLMTVAGTTTINRGK